MAGYSVTSWLQFLKYDPLPPLRAVDNPALQYFVRRDLLGEDPGPVERLWNLSHPQKLLRKQQADGSWPDPHVTKHRGAATNYALLETYRALGVLVEMYGLTRCHPGVEKAGEFCFSTQSAEGDFRGIYGTQYSPNYTGGILELLVKVGFEEDRRVTRAFEWFVANQQQGGGWTLPIQTHGFKTYEWDQIATDATIHPFQPEKPFCHSVTGIVLRAFAAHPTFRHHPAARQAADLITTRFFKSNKYSFRGTPAYWTKYSFPFWWADLISVLDALSQLDGLNSNPGVNQALQYYRSHQFPSGAWDLYGLKGKSVPDMDAWITFTLCRALKRLCGT